MDGFTSIQKEMQEWCYDIAAHVVLFQRMGVIWNIISNTRVKKKKKKKDLQDINFSLSPPSSGRLTHHPKPTV